MSQTTSDQPDAHYDNVTQAWRLLMGVSFHYGFFSSEERDLDLATAGLTEQMALAGRIESSQLVLDVGCGIGGPATALAHDRDCRVVGISTSEVGIREANERAADTGLSEKLSFLLRDGMDNGFDADSFDRIWVMESSHLMPDKAAMIRDSVRALKPGGRLVLCDIMTHRVIPLTEVLQHAQDFDLLRKVFGRAKMETLDAYQGWLEEAGLEVDLREDISTETAPTFDCWRSNANRHREAVIALIGEEALSDFHASCDVLRRMWAEGILGYGLIAAGKPR